MSAGDVARILLVTGGSLGIGAAIARLAAAGGYAVAVKLSEPPRRGRRSFIDGTGGR